MSPYPEPKRLGRKYKQELITLMKLGEYSDDVIHRMIRLLELRPTKEERARWVKAGILTEEGFLNVDKDEVENFTILSIILWNLAYLGAITKKEIDPMKELIK